MTKAKPGSKSLRTACHVMLWATCALQLLLAYWHSSAVLWLNGLDGRDYQLFNVRLFIPLVPAGISFCLLRIERPIGAAIAALLGLAMASFLVGMWFILSRAG